MLVKMPFFADGPNRKSLLIQEIWSHSLIWALWTPFSLGWDRFFLCVLLQILWGRFTSVPPRTQFVICNLYLRLGGINQSFSLTSSLRTLFAGIYLQSYWMLGGLTALEERCFFACNWKQRATNTVQLSSFWWKVVFLSVEILVSCWIVFNKSLVLCKRLIKKIA